MFHHMFVVDDLMQDIDRQGTPFQCFSDHPQGTLHSGTETASGGKVYDSAHTGYFS